MSTFISPELLVGAHAKHPHQQAADFLSFTSPSDIVVPGPHPDIFESELDLSLAEAEFDSHQLQTFLIAKPDVFNFLRQDALSYGTPSIITTSSESASSYESFSSHSESLYNYPASTYSNPLNCDFNMDFSGASINAPEYNSASTQGSMSTDSASDYYRASGSSPVSVASTSATAVDEFENVCNAAPSAGFQGDTTFSDYGGSDYYLGSSHRFEGYPTSISPTEISSRAQSQLSAPQARFQSTVTTELLPSLSRSSYLVPRTSSAMLSMHGEETSDDPKKKHRCDECRKRFARAFNLKTHKETHDRHRRKPFICDVDTCKRPFSRKHDLQRHKVSLHQNDKGRFGKEVRAGLPTAKDGGNGCDSCATSGHKECLCAAGK